MVISGNEDLLEYSMIYCGYLINQMEKDTCLEMIPDLIEIKDNK